MQDPFPNLFVHSNLSALTSTALDVGPTRGNAEEEKVKRGKATQSISTAVLSACRHMKTSASTSFLDTQAGKHLWNTGA